jgi:copper homeostasis protein
VTGTLLESVVETVDQARAAARAGADRLELCVRLATGGVTPPPALQEAVIGAVSIPVFVMIRPRPGDFVYTDAELAQASHDMAAARAFGAAGIVLGLLLPDGRIDVDRTRQLVRKADGLPVTFHRAFDAVRDQEAALEDAIAAGVTRLLTSGGAATALDGADRLRTLVDRAGDRLTVIAGGGVRAGNVRALLRRTGVREVHARFEDAAQTRALADLL